jgi:hypothetical protein
MKVVNRGLKTLDFCKLGCLAHMNGKHTRFLINMVKLKSYHMRKYNWNIIIPLETLDSYFVRRNLKRRSKWMEKFHIFSFGTEI